MIKVCNPVLLITAYQLFNSQNESCYNIVTYIIIKTVMKLCIQYEFVHNDTYLVNEIDDGISE